MPAAVVSRVQLPVQHPGPDVAMIRAGLDRILARVEANAAADRLDQRSAEELLKEVTRSSFGR